MASRRKFLGSLSGLAAAPAAAMPPAPQRNSLEGDLLAAIDRIPLVNTHEHIIPEAERVGLDVDFFTLAGHYAISDVISAGLGGDDLRLVRDETASARDRWAAFEPHWNNARFTGYGQALRIAIEDIYGVAEISGATIDEINRRIRDKNKPGLYEDVLVTRSNIAYSVLDDYWNPSPIKPDPHFFVYARKFDRFVAPQSADDVRELEN